MRMQRHRIASTLIFSVVVTPFLVGVAAAAGPTSVHGFCHETPSLTSCAGNIGGAVCPPNGKVVVLGTPWSLLDVCTMPQP